MNIQILTTAALMALASPVLASGSHTGGHDDEMAVGKAGDAHHVTRTIEVTMKETDDGMMIFEPGNLDINPGETIRFKINNMGELDHEFVLDTMEGITEHKALMEKFPEMEHDDPNAISLASGETGEIIWTFSNTGTFEFACMIPGHYDAGMHGDVIVAELSGSYTKGVVKKIDLKKKKITIIHEELANLGMPAMTMVFRILEEEMLAKIQAGDEIQFVAERVKGKLTVTKLK